MVKRANKSFPVPSQVWLEQILPQRAIRLALRMHVNKIFIDPPASIAIPLCGIWLHAE